MIHKNPDTDFCVKEYMPEIDPTAFIHPFAAVIGHTFIGKKVMVSPFASVVGMKDIPFLSEMNRIFKMVLSFTVLKQRIMVVLLKVI